MTFGIEKMYRFCLTFCLLLFISCNVMADVLVDLYESEISVPDRTDEAFNKAIEKGLSKVIVKLSGDKAVLELPKIIKLTKSARSLLVRYGYSVKESNEKLFLKVEFDKDEVLKKLVAVGAPIWTANRSPVMALLVFQDRFGRTFLDSDSDNELRMELEGAFSERGVSLRYPLLDLTDYAVLSVDSVWDKNKESFQHVIDRYGIEDILVGRLSQLSSGQWIGEWIYQDDEKEINRFIDLVDLRGMFATGADLVATTMASRFSVKSIRSDDSSGPILRVVGIEGFGDYISLISWLERVEIIEYADLDRIVDHVVEFRLTSVASRTDLANIINLNSDLIPLSSADNFDRLTFKWRSWGQESP